MNELFRWSKVFTFAGAIVAYLIGSGFASGQEAMQFFTAFGPAGCFGAIVITLLLYIWFSSVIMEDGRRLQLDSANKIFTYYCGRYLGKFFEIFTPIFLFLVFSVMIAGAGATLNEYYGLNPQTGRIIMAVLALGTVILGLDGLVSIVSKIGPAIIIFAVIVGIGNIVMNPSGLAKANETMASIKVTKAASNWLISGIIFPAMGCIMLAPFLAQLGKEAGSKKEAKTGGFIGGFAFAAAVMVMAYGLMASIGDLYNKDVPSLFIADKMFPAIGILFSVILFAGIYTTAVPMLWLSCNRLVSDEKDKKFKILALILTIIAFIGGQFSFSALVNSLYPISGYFGIILMLCILKTQLKKKEVPSVEIKKVS